jgi:hypothetical protein
MNPTLLCRFFRKGGFKNSMKLLIITPPLFKPFLMLKNAPPSNDQLNVDLTSATYIKVKMSVTILSGSPLSKLFRMNV